MIEKLKAIFGLAPNVNYKKLIQDGAQIIDVRTKTEFDGGHLKGSVNIPLHILNGNLNRLKKDRPVITCCASGIRSASAKSLLKSKGFAEVHNGGSWVTLRNKIS